jgi:hypothetical protein
MVNLEHLLKTFARNRARNRSASRVYTVYALVLPLVFTRLAKYLGGCEQNVGKLPQLVAHSRLLCMKSYDKLSFDSPRILCPGGIAWPWLGFFYNPSMVAMWGQCSVCLRHCILISTLFVR